MELPESELVPIISAGLTVNIVAAGPITLLAYDYVITLDDEIRYIWMRKKTGASILFLIIRYMGLMTWCGLEAITYVQSLPIESCTLLDKTQALMEIILYLPIGAFAALRALALSGMNWQLAALVFILASGPFAINLWIYIGAGIYGLERPIVGCTTASNETAREARIGVSVSRSCAIASDILVLAITWWYATRGGMTWRARGIPGCKSSLVRTMVLRGTTYFLALLILNGLHLALTLLSQDITAQQAVSLVPLFTDPLTVIIICRFLLALQSANVKITGQETADSQLGRGGEYGGSLRFAELAIMGSMGGVVDIEHDEGSVNDRNDDAFGGTLTLIGQSEEDTGQESRQMHA